MRCCKRDRSTFSGSYGTNPGGGRDLIIRRHAAIQVKSRPKSKPSVADHRYAPELEISAVSKSFRKLKEISFYELSFERFN